MKKIIFFVVLLSVWGKLIIKLIHQVHRSPLEISTLLLSSHSRKRSYITNDCILMCNRCYILTGDCFCLYLYKIPALSSLGLLLLMGAGWLVATMDNKPYITTPWLLFSLWSARINRPTCLEQGIWLTVRLVGAQQNI